MKKNAPYLAIAAFGLLTGAAGCTDSGKTLLIVQNQVAGEGCVISGSIGNTYLGRGIIDTNASIGYIFNPVIQNRATSSKTATRVAFIEGYEVNISFPDGSVTGDFGDLTAFSRRTSASIFPGGNAGMSFEIVPVELLQAIGLAAGDSVELVAEVSVFGTMDGGDVESTKFAFPITVCNGCMEVNLGPCSEIAAGFEAQTGGECNTLQDVPIECCTMSDSSLLCPAEQEVIVVP